MSSPTLETQSPNGQIRSMTPPLINGLYNNSIHKQAKQLDDMSSPTLDTKSPNGQIPSMSPPLVKPSGQIPSMTPPLIKPGQRTPYGGTNNAYGKVISGGNSSYSPRMRPILGAFDYGSDNGSMDSPGSGDSGVISNYGYQDGRRGAHNGGGGGGRMGQNRQSAFDNIRIPLEQQLLEIMRSNQQELYGGKGNSGGVGVGGGNQQQMGYGGGNQQQTGYGGGNQQQTGYGGDEYGFNGRKMFRGGKSVTTTNNTQIHIGSYD